MNFQPSEILTKPITIIGVLFFVFGFVTWLGSVLIPYLKIACELNNLESYLVAFSFYISYLIMAIPSAFILKITGYKKGMAIGLMLMALGSVIFIPAALSRTYFTFLFGLFIQGTGLAILQTASNPYITILGPKESAARRISIMGICNGIAGIIAPVILGSIILDNADTIQSGLSNLSETEKAIKLQSLADRVIMPYLIITLILVFLSIFVYLSKLPEIDTDHEDGELAAANQNKSSILQFPHLLLGVITLFLYVGVEVIAGDTIISYAGSEGIALSTAKYFTSFTLSAMLAGYLIGIICIPKYLKQETALIISAIIGLFFAFTAVWTNGLTSVIFVALLGLSNSLMWPSIWPLAIADLGRFTKIGSSLMIMAVGGGALLPLAYGHLADLFNHRDAYWIIVPCYLMILYYSLYGHKIRTA